MPDIEGSPSLIGSKIENEVPASCRLDIACILGVRIFIVEIPEPDVLSWSLYLGIVGWYMASLGGGCLCHSGDRCVQKLDEGTITCIADGEHLLPKYSEAA